MRLIRRARYTIPLKLDLGCKDKKRPGYVGLDATDFGQDVLWNVLDGLPFPDDSVTEIVAAHFFEHIADGDMDDLFHEIIRVCRNGASIHFSCPHANTLEAFYVCHASLWDERRLKGIEAGLQKRIEVLETSRQGIELIAELRVHKT